MKRTKIFCTVGPASESASTLEAMIRSGMNVARLNFSHGEHAWHKKAIRTIRSLSKKLNEPVAVLADLQGPKIRVGVLPERGIELKNGATVTLPVTYPALYKDVKKGDRILIEDGIMETTYVSGARGKMTVKVVNGGTVFSHKGMNFPDSTLKVGALTAKDKADAAFAVKEGVDWIALSFVTSPNDVRMLRRLTKGSGVKIMVKIEKHEALDGFEDILEEADGVMVARGDLGVETPAEEVPIRQKEMIGLCRLAGKPVVVATKPA
ncbi:pyruvate kinase, partial [bacterium]|nr:pyruvate kinase [bacterium]